MSETFYSDNGEDYCYSSIEDACDSFMNDESVEIGQKVTIYQGELLKKESSYYMNRLIDNAADVAFDECGECIGDWPNLSQEETVRLFDIIDRWFTDNKKQPNFGLIGDVKELHYLVTDLECCDTWEVVKDDNT